MVVHWIFLLIISIIPVSGRIWGAEGVGVGGGRKETRFTHFTHYFHWKPSAAANHSRSPHNTPQHTGVPRCTPDPLHGGLTPKREREMLEMLLPPVRHRHHHHHHHGGPFWMLLTCMLFSRGLLWSFREESNEDAARYGKATRRIQVLIPGKEIKIDPSCVSFSLSTVETAPRATYPPPSIRA